MQQTVPREITNFAQLREIMCQHRSATRSRELWTCPHALPKHTSDHSCSAAAADVMTTQYHNTNHIETITLRGGTLQQNRPNVLLQPAHRTMLGHHMYKALQAIFEPCAAAYMLLLLAHKDKLLIIC
jgi:hypothetical protein